MASETLLLREAAIQDRTQHPVMVERFLTPIRSLSNSRLDTGIAEVEKALGPLKALAASDPEAEREAEWILALAVLEGAMLALLRQVDETVAPTETPFVEVR